MGCGLPQKSGEENLYSCFPLKQKKKYIKYGKISTTNNVRYVSLEMVKTLKPVQKELKERYKIVILKVSKNSKRQKRSHCVLTLC